MHLRKYYYIAFTLLFAFLFSMSSLTSKPVYAVSYGKIVVTKQDPGGTKLGGWYFMLFRWTGTTYAFDQSGTTASSGGALGTYTFENLLYNQYVVCEVSQTDWEFVEATGFSNVDTASACGELQLASTTKNVTFVNRLKATPSDPIGTLRIKKVVTNWSGGPKTYTICFTGPSPSTTKRCGDVTITNSGFEYLEWNDVTPGEYLITEDPLPSADWVVTYGNSDQKITVIKDQKVYMQITNDYKPGALKAKKQVIWNGVTPETKNFSICIEGPSYPTKNCKNVTVTPPATEAWAEWTNLIPGQYTVTEDPHPGSQWNVIYENQVVTVTNGGTTSSTVVKNSRNLPGIEIKKYTNTFDADNANDSDVPHIPAGQDVIWTYVVSNTGQIAFAQDEVKVTDNVLGTEIPFNSVLTGDADNLLEPGELWLYKATAKAPVLSYGPAYIVDGCKTGENTYRPTYENYGFVEVTKYGLSDSDPSHYCNPPKPNIEIKKYTNGFDADNANGSDVPSIGDTQEVVWTYVVSNTGDIAFAKDKVVVTDDVLNKQIDFNSVLSGDADTWLEPGELWLYRATGTAPILTYGPKHIVDGCKTGENTYRPTYENYGFVNVTEYGLSDSDPSHYCNPPKPGIEIKKYTNGFDADDPNGSDVPNIANGVDVVWTYIVSNTGDIAFAKDKVVVTDNVLNKQIDFDSVLSGDADNWLEPGELWLYKASAKATALSYGPEHVVEGCKVGEKEYRPTYRNFGYVTVTEYQLFDQDPSHYCNTLKAGLGDRVWFDENTNGIQDGNEPGVPGVKVTLLQADCITPTSDPAKTQLTDANGFYLFSDLEPGDYCVHFEQPSGYSFTTRFTGGNVAVDSNANRDTGQSDATNLEAGEYDLTFDAGLILRTLNVQAEPICLKDAPYIRYTVTPVNFYPEATTVTVRYLDATTGAVIKELVGQLLTQDLLWEGAAIDQNTGVGVQWPGWKEENGKWVQIPTNLRPKVKIEFSINPTNVVELTYPPSSPTCSTDPRAALGDRVWYDTNKNGLQDAGEANVPGVKVTLFNSANEQVGTPQTTDSNGNYLFTGLYPGSYYVQFDSSTLPAGYLFTTANATEGGSDIATDSDADPSTGKTQSVTLAAGDKYLDLDAGIVTNTPPGLAELGDKVWYDTNKNGIQDGGESGVPDVPVKLLDATCTNVMGETKTGSNGNYIFTGLQPGTYCVQFDISKVPGNYVYTQKDQGGDDALDSDADSTTGKTAPVTLKAGDSNLTLDAGIITVGPPPGLAELGDKVWYDKNSNGIQDGGELGVPNVTVKLLDATCTEVMGETKTDSNGNYIFTGLQPGTYCVQFDISTVPGEYTYSPKDQGGDDALDSDAEPTTGKTASVTLNAGDSNLTLDAGLVEKTLTIQAEPLCIKDAPYIRYKVTPNNLVPAPTGVTIRYRDFTTNEIIKELLNQPLSQDLLWEGAAVDPATGVGVQWPGWKEENGKWVQIPTNLRPKVKIEFSINPTSVIEVNYPPATPTCSTDPRVATVPPDQPTNLPDDKQPQAETRHLFLPSLDR